MEKGQLLPITQFYEHGKVSVKNIRRANEGTQLRHKVREPNVGALARIALPNRARPRERPYGGRPQIEDPLSRLVYATESLNFNNFQLHK